MASKYSTLNPNSISYETVKTDLIEYVKNLPEGNKWKDFYESGAGTTQIELISGLGAFLSFHSLGARRESYLDTCKLYTSAINLCNIIGYPVNRVSAPRLKVSFGITSSVFWDREVPVFAYKGRNVSLLHSQTIVAGQQELELVIGDWKTVDYTSTKNDKFSNLLIMDTGIDNYLFKDTLELFINGVPYTLIKYADEFLPNNVLLKTYQGGILLVFGDGYIGYQIRVNDQLKFNYVNTSGAIQSNQIEPSDLTKFLSCTINSVQVLNPGYQQDSIPKMAAVAPGYLTAKRRMVTGFDHVYIFENYSGSLISAGYKKDNGAECCTILLSYLFEDEHFASITEKDDMYLYLDDYRMVGERIIIMEPIKIGLEMKIVVIVEEGYQQSDFENQTREIISKYIMQLGTTFHLGQVTAELGALEGVFRVYLVRPVSDKNLDYREYLKLVGLQIIITANKKYFVSVDPDNHGYWYYLTSSTCTGIQTYKLLDSNAHFTVSSLVVGSLVTNKDLGLSAHITAITSNTELILDSDIFTVVGQTYELYPTQA